MFGNHTPLADGNTAAHGFQALAEFDDNSDDWIDQNDEVYSRLRLWIDANRYGVSGTEEYSTLQAVGRALVTAVPTDGEGGSVGERLPLPSPS